jgi:hypothetical protein
MNIAQANETQVKLACRKVSAVYIRNIYVANISFRNENTKNKSHKEPRKYHFARLFAI